MAFDHEQDRDFYLVIGANGQHSNVRRLAFGEEDRFARYLGGYICGYTMRNELGIARRIHRDYFLWDVIDVRRDRNDAPLLAD